MNTVTSQRSSNPRPIQDRLREQRQVFERIQTNLLESRQRILQLRLLVGSDNNEPRPK